MNAPLMSNGEIAKPQDKNYKIKLAAAIALVILSIGFFAIVAFTYGRSNVKSPAPTFDDEEVMPVSSAQGIAVGEPNPNTPAPTPIPIESELTYTYPEAFNFQVTYTAANWTVTSEPTNLKKFDPLSYTPDNNVLTLTSTADSNDRVDFVFTKTTGNELNGVKLEVCGSDYKIIKEATRGNADALLRLYQGDSGTYVYANTYYPSETNSNEICIWNSRPIYYADEQDNYYIVNIYTHKNNKLLDEVDKMIQTYKFAQ